MNKVEHRNIFAHGAFIFDLDAPNDFYRILSNKKKDVFPISTEDITLDQLNQLIDEVRTLVTQTADLTVTLKASTKK